MERTIGCIGKLKVSACTLRWYFFGHFLRIFAPFRAKKTPFSPAKYKSLPQGAQLARYASRDTIHEFALVLLCTFFLKMFILY